MSWWKYMFFPFGTGKGYIPQDALANTIPPSTLDMTASNICGTGSGSAETVSSLGLLDTLFLDKESVEQIKNVLKAMDAEKIRAVMGMIEKDQDGWIRLRIELGVKKND